MSERADSIGRYFADWEIYNERMVEVIRDLSPTDLAIRPSPDLWPIWGTVGHTAGARVYWLCGVFGEPGAERTPFSVADLARGIGWEDDPDTPRTSEELVKALESTWRIVEGCLERWTPDVLFQEFERESRGRTERHTRQSVLIRMLSHDAYHCGELSQTLGIHGLPQIDLWRSE